jgi:ribose 5-phosphate isomerase B
VRIAISADLTGVHVKDRLEPLLVEEGYDLVDFGADLGGLGTNDNAARRVAEAVGAGEFDRGILLGAGAHRETIVANRVPGVRCTLCWDVVSAAWARQVVDANVLALPWGRLDFEDLIDVTQHWLETPTELRHRTNGDPGRRRSTAGAAPIAGPSILDVATRLPHCSAVEDGLPFVCNWCRAEFRVPVDVTGGSGGQVEECPVCCRENAVRVEVDDSGAISALADRDLTE